MQGIEAARSATAHYDDPDVVIIGAGASGAAVAWSLASAGFKIVVPGARRLGQPADAAALPARLGAAPPHRLQRRSERARPSRRLPRQRRRLDVQPADVQRRRRQHDPLERPLPALPSLRLPGALARRRRRRLAADLRRAGAVLRPQRPHDRRLRGRPATRPSRRARRARPRRSRSGRSARRWRAASTSSAGTGGRPTPRSSPQQFDGRPACNNCGPCDVGCPTGARSSADVTYWPLALRLGVELRTRCRVREITVDEQGRARGVLYYDESGRAPRAARAARHRRRNGVGTPRLLLNSRSRHFPDGLANRTNMVGKCLMFHPFATASGVLPDSRGQLQGADWLLDLQPRVLRDRRVARLHARLHDADRPRDRAAQRGARRGDGHPRAVGLRAPRGVRRRASGASSTWG